MYERGRSYFIVVCMLFAAVFLFANESDEGPKFGFKMGISIGAETFNETDPLNPTGDLIPVAYQTLSLQPDFSFGKFGIGLDLTFHYRFTSEGGSNFDFREEDWVPGEGKTAAEIYLPLFRYIRWGEKGDDLYVKLGSVDYATLGKLLHYG